MPSLRAHREGAVRSRSGPGSDMTPWPLTLGGALRKTPPRDALFALLQRTAEDGCAFEPALLDPCVSRGVPAGTASLAPPSFPALDRLQTHSIRDTSCRFSIPFLTRLRDGGGAVGDALDFLATRTD